jgi:hypothetical protein
VARLARGENPNEMFRATKRGKGCHSSHIEMSVGVDDGGSNSLREGCEIGSTRENNPRIMASGTPLPCTAASPHDPPNKDQCYLVLEQGK